MEVSMSKAFSLGTLLITFMILLNTSSSMGTSASLPKNFHGINATIGDNMEFEFLYSSEIGRMLADGDDSFLTPDALIAEEAVVKTCGRGKPYHGCVPSPNPRPVQETCSTYKRGCPKPSA
ncbi:hypothetical protein PTKIN_Ptkin12aG0022900 [Pterospermum kingtungense]